MGRVVLRTQLWRENLRKQFSEVSVGKRVIHQLKRPGASFAGRRRAVNMVTGGIRCWDAECRPSPSGKCLILSTSRQRYVFSLLNCS